MFYVFNAKQRGVKGGCWPWINVCFTSSGKLNASFNLIWMLTMHGINILFSLIWRTCRLIFNTYTIINDLSWKSALIHNRPLVLNSNPQFLKSFVSHTIFRRQMNYMYFLNLCINPFLCIYFYIIFRYYVCRPKKRDQDSVRCEKSKIPLLINQHR